MIPYHIASLPRPLPCFQDAYQVVIGTLQFTAHNGLDILGMSPKPPNVPVIWRYFLLFHLVGIFYAIVPRTIRAPDSLKARSGSEVFRVSSPTDSIPRLACPLLHLAPYPYAPQHYMNVWRAPALEFEKPQHTQSRRLASQGVQEIVQVPLHTLAIAWKFFWIREGKHRGKHNISV